MKRTANDWASGTLTLSTVILSVRGSLARTGDEAGGMAKCRTEISVLDTLSPGLHRLQFVLRRGERSRVEAQGEYWFWQDLTGYEGTGFHVSATPTNLLRSECRGFRFQANSISHLADQYHRHTLAFEVEGRQAKFYWTQPGVFVESLERRPGKHAEPRSHVLGEAFPASLTSARWLRIWLAGQREWEVVVAGKIWHRDMGCDRREFLELSLAT